MQKLPGISLKLFKKDILYLTPNRPKLRMWLVRYHSSPFLSTRSSHCEVSNLSTYRTFRKLLYPHQCRGRGGILIYIKIGRYTNIYNTYIYLSVYLSVCLSACLFIYLSIYLSIYHLPKYYFFTHLKSNISKTDRV